MQVFYFYSEPSLKIGGKLSLAPSLSTIRVQASMHSTQSRLDFEPEEDVDSLHLPLCKSKVWK